MNLLIDDFPSEIIDVNGTLYFDADTLSDEDCAFEGDCIHYKIATSNRDIIDIMMLYEDSSYCDEDKRHGMLKILYKDNIPYDRHQACTKAMEFLNCGEKGEKGTNKAPQHGRLWTWEQDGNYIYAAINYSHNDILKREPDLHWWEFVNKFMQLKEDCQFNHIVANRLAYKKDKMTDEQKTARREYPEIYVLREQRRIDDKRMTEFKEMERKLNNG